MTIFYQTSNDLKSSRLVMHKLGETFTDFQTRSFSIVSLCEQWRTLQGSFSKVHSSLEERVKEVEAIETEIDVAKNKLKDLQTEVELRKKKLDLEEKSLRERINEVKEWRESLELEKRLLGERCKAVEVGEKRNKEGFEQVKEQLKAVEERERVIMESIEDMVLKVKVMSNKEGFEQVKEQLKVVEERERVIMESIEDMVLKAKVMSERAKALDAKEKELNMKESLLEQKEVKLEGDKNDMDELYFALERKEKENNEQSSILKSKEKMLGLKEKEIDERSEVLEPKEKRVLEGTKAMELERKQMDERSRQIELKEKEIEERILALQMKEKQFYSHEKELVVRDDNQINDCNKGIEAKENELDDQLDKSLEEQRDGFQEKQSESSSLTKVRQKLPDSEIHIVACPKDNSSSSNIAGEQIRSSCINMDAVLVRSYLYEHAKAKDISSEEILDALRYAPDPRKLVIEVTRTFYQRFPDMDTATIYKDGCILLLEQLMKLSPPIMDDVKEEAKQLAITFKDSKGRTPTDNYGFLLFVAAFELADCFDANDLVLMFGSLYGGPKIYWHEQQVLCSALGLSDNIPGLIKSYIERYKLLTAVKCICIFKLEHIFPPVPLLGGYLDLNNNKVNEKWKEETFDSKIVTDMELCMLRELTSCIATCKLESKFPPDSFLLRIEELLKEKKDRKVALKQWNKRSASSCDSVASPKQPKKRHRARKNNCTK